MAALTSDAVSAEADRLERLHQIEVSSAVELLRQAWLLLDKAQTILHGEAAGSINFAKVTVEDTGRKLAALSTADG